MFGGAIMTESMSGNGTQFIKIGKNNRFIENQA